MPTPPSKGAMQPRFFAPQPRWSEHLLGTAVPKPRPLSRPPPRSLVYRPPTAPIADRIKPLGLITEKDLPSRQQVTSENKPRQSSKPSPRDLVSRASQEHNRKEACLVEWQEILLLMGSASGLQSSLANSKYPQALLKKSLEKFTAGTLERYLAAVKQFLDFLGLSNRSVASIDVSFLADFLHACENSLEEDREICKIGPRPILKALSWLGRNADVSALQHLLQASLIRAFLTQPTSDRKEALPLPLAVVVEWEKYICSPHCPQDLRLFLGGLLLALHGGLRFGDLQRIRLNSLSLTSTSLRGVCWQTKTTKRGQPFAVTLHGLSGRSLDSLWVLPFLQAMQSAWIATESAMGMSVIPDFILPVLTNLGGLSRPTSIYAQPMAYSQSLAAMRHFLTIPWQDSTTPRPPQKPKRTALQPRRYDPSPGPSETNMPSVCTGMATGTAYSQGRPASYLRAPFSRGQIAAQAGLSGFILWGRGVTLRLLEGSRPRVLGNPTSVRVRPRISAQPPACDDSRSNPRRRHRSAPGGEIRQSSPQLIRVRGRA